MRKPNAPQSNDKTRWTTRCSQTPSMGSKTKLVISDRFQRVLSGPAADMVKAEAMQEVVVAFVGRCTTSVKVTVKLTQRSS